MSILARGSRRCLNTLYHQNVSMEPNPLIKHLSSRTYQARSPLLLRNFKLTSPRFPSSYHFYSSSSFSPKNGFIGWYLGMLESRPVLTKSLSSSLIYTFADLSSQAITQKSFDSFDLIRTLRMAGYGMLVMGPSMHFWFNSVSRVLPKRDLLNTFKKIILGQTVYGPTMTTIFFSVNAGLQGENGAEIVARLKRDLLPTLFSGLMYWPVCDFITFKFIPVRLQPLVSNSFAFMWTIYLTYMAALEKAGASSISASEPA